MRKPDDVTYVICGWNSGDRLGTVTDLCSAENVYAGTYTTVYVALSYNVKAHYMSLPLFTTVFNDKLYWSGRGLALLLFSFCYYSLI